jgi:hypothetical protein
MQVQMRCGELCMPSHICLSMCLLLDDEGSRVRGFVVRRSWFRGSGLNGPLCPLFLAPRCRWSRCGLDWIGLWTLHCGLESALFAFR